MSPTGHQLTAFPVGVALGYPLFLQGQYYEAALTLAGAMLGARAPDWLEMAKWVNGVRISLIPHRGPTHWPGFWLIALIASIMYVPSPMVSMCIGFASTGLLHLLLDVMTPSGIPVWHPFARPTTLNAYRSGEFFKELMLVMLIWSACWCLIFLF